MWQDLQAFVQHSQITAPVSWMRNKLDHSYGFIPRPLMGGRSHPNHPAYLSTDTLSSPSTNERTCGGRCDAWTLPKLKPKIVSRNFIYTKESGVTWIWDQPHFIRFKFESCTEYCPASCEILSIHISIDTSHITDNSTVCSRNYWGHHKKYKTCGKETSGMESVSMSPRHESLTTISRLWYPQFGRLWWHLIPF